MKYLIIILMLVSPILGQEVLQLRHLGDGVTVSDIANKNQSCDCYDLGFNRQFDIARPKYNRTYTYNVIGSITLTTTLKEYGNGDVVSFSSNSPFVNALIIESGNRAGYHIFEPPTDDGDGQWWYLPQNRWSDKPSKISGLSFCYNISPSAATVSVSGKLVAESPAHAVITLTRLSDGAARYTRTNNFGNFVFTDVEINDLYNLGGSGKDFTIIDKQIFLTEGASRIILNTYAK